MNLIKPALMTLGAFAVYLYARREINKAFGEEEEGADEPCAPCSPFTQATHCGRSDCTDHGCMNAVTHLLEGEFNPDPCPQCNAQDPRTFTQQGERWTIRYACCGYTKELGADPWPVW